MKQERSRSYRTHSFDEGRRAVMLYESGLGSDRIAKKTGLDGSMIRMGLCMAYATALEPASSVTRRFSLDDLSSGYRMKRFYPESGQDRLRLKEECIAINQ